MKKYLFFLFIIGAFVSCAQDKERDQSIADSLFVQIANSPEYFQYERALSTIKPFIFTEYRDLNMDSLHQKVVSANLEMDENCYVSDPGELTDREQRYLHLSCRVDRRIGALDAKFPVFRTFEKEDFSLVREMFLNKHPAFDVENKQIIENLKKH